MGMNDMWDTMCHEERRKRCSTPLGILHLKQFVRGGGGGGGGGEGKNKKKERRKTTKRKENQKFSDQQTEELQ